MNKLAAEKIASEYYNLGVQLALQNAGLTKTASPLKALAGMGALGLSPAALQEAGLLASQTGLAQSGALRSLLAGQTDNALGFLRGMGTAAKGDLANLTDHLRMLGHNKTMAELAESLPSAGA